MEGITRNAVRTRTAGECLDLNAGKIPCSWRTAFPRLGPEPTRIDQRIPNIKI